MFSPAGGVERAADAASQAEVLVQFTEHGAALYRFCRFTLRRDADAEDVVQETFLKLVAHLHRGGDRANLRAWLFAVAANGCRDRLRWRSRWRPWSDRSHDRGVEPDDEAPDRAAAVAALDRLGPRDRLLLALRGQGLSYREIATASGIREQSVGKLLSRAVDRWKHACRGTS